MADNNMKIGFVDSSTVVSNYLINYYIIERYKISSIAQITLMHQLGFYIISLRSWFYRSQIRIEIIHTANGTAITSTVWNIAHVGTKQNDSVRITTNLPTRPAKL